MASAAANATELRGRMFGPQGRRGEDIARGACADMQRTRRESRSLFSELLGFPAPLFTSHSKVEPRHGGEVQSGPLPFHSENEKRPLHYSS
jgi:hypothetical protein